MRSHTEGPNPNDCYLATCSCLSSRRITDYLSAQIGDHIQRIHACTCSSRLFCISSFCPPTDGCTSATAMAGSWVNEGQRHRGCLQMEALKTLGCRRAQGSHISRRGRPELITRRHLGRQFATRRPSHNGNSAQGDGIAVCLTVGIFRNTYRPELARDHRDLACSAGQPGRYASQRGVAGYNVTCRRRLRRPSAAPERSTARNCRPG